MHSNAGHAKCQLNSGPRKESGTRTKKGENLLRHVSFPDARGVAIFHVLPSCYLF